MARLRWGGGEGGVLGRSKRGGGAGELQLTQVEGRDVTKYQCDGGGGGGGGVSCDGEKRADRAE